MIIHFKSAIMLFFNLSAGRYGIGLSSGLLGQMKVSNSNLNQKCQIFFLTPTVTDHNFSVLCIKKCLPLETDQGTVYVVNWHVSRWTE